MARLTAEKTATRPLAMRSRTDAETDATLGAPRAPARNRSDRSLVKNRRRLHRRALNSSRAARSNSVRPSTATRIALRARTNLQVRTSAKTESTLRGENHPRRPLQGWLRGSADHIEVSACHLPDIKHRKDDLAGITSNSRENQAAVLISFFNCTFRRIEFSVQCAAFSLSSIALRNPSFCLMFAWY